MFTLGGAGRRRRNAFMVEVGQALGRGNLFAPVGEPRAAP